MGFPVSVVVSSASPCLYMRIQTAANTDVEGSWAAEMSFFITIPFITAVLHSCGANVLYIQMNRVTPRELVFDFFSFNYFVSLFFFFFFFLNFSDFFF